MFYPFWRWLRPKDQTNLLPGLGRGGFAETWLGLIPLTEPKEGPLLLSLRPEALRLLPPGQGLVGQVVVRAFKGHDLTYRVRIGDREVLVQEGPETPFREGDKVRVEVVGQGVPLSAPQVQERPLKVEACEGSSSS